MYFCRWFLTKVPEVEDWVGVHNDVWFDLVVPLDSQLRMRLKIKIWVY
jgi:hypothetical protein